MSNAIQIAIQNALAPLSNAAEIRDQCVRREERWRAEHRAQLDADRRSLDALDAHQRAALEQDANESAAAASSYFYREWSNLIGRAAQELASCGANDLAGQLRTFLRQIEDRDELGACAFDFADLKQWLDRTKEAIGSPHGDAKWITVAEAARIAFVNKGTISRAADAGELKSNGKRGRERRIDAASLSLWQLNRANRPERQESEAAIRRKLGE